jgi:aspartyl protease family protein
MRRIPLAAICGVAIVGAWLLISAAESARGDEASAKAALEAKGIKATHSGFSTHEETEFSKAVTAAYALKRKLAATTYQEHSAGSENGEVDAEIETLTEQNQVLKQRLAQLNQTPIAFRGQITQELNQQVSANDNQIAQLQQSKKQSTKSVDELRQTENTARQTYVQQVFEARKLADRVVAQYAELNKDQDVAAALKEWNEAIHKSNALKPSHGFESSLKRLEALEKKLHSEKIPLKQQGLDYFATVTINGEKTCDMVVDATAPTVLLPYQTALDAGLKVDAPTETPAKSADVFSKTPPTPVILKSVRVGSFTAKNVACGVLPAKNTSAKAVLGMSFLGQFKFEISAGGSELSLLSVDGEPATTKRKKKPAPKHVHKKSVNPAPSDNPQE